MQLEQPAVILAFDLSSRRYYPVTLDARKPENLLSKLHHRDEPEIGILIMEYNEHHLHGFETMREAELYMLELSVSMRGQLNENSIINGYAIPIGNVRQIESMKFLCWKWNNLDDPLIPGKVFMNMLPEAALRARTAPPAPAALTL